MTLNDAFEIELKHRRMNVMGVEVKTFTSQPQSVEP